MRSTLIAAVALLALAAPVLAQPIPASDAAAQLRSSALPPWMQDDGSSSDHPVPMPGDISGDTLNSAYQGGIGVPPPNGLPAPYRLR